VKKDFKNGSAVRRSVLLLKAMSYPGRAFHRIKKNGYYLIKTGVLFYGFQETSQMEYGFYSGGDTYLRGYCFRGGYVYAARADGFVRRA
jgi:hypothetical protein